MTAVARSLAGLTKTECASACAAAGCAITGLGRCCHPCKGGLPIERVNDPDIQAAYTAACSMIGVSNIYTKETA